jgi:dTDP-glucose 4,6-dehydratase
VLQAAIRNNVSRVLQTSTSEVYGTARTVPITEEHPLQGQSPYSATKIGADKIAESFFLSFGLPVVIVRPFNTYGPRQSARAVIPTIVAQAIKEKAISLGNLEPTRDLNYVADTVEGFVKAAEASAAIGEVINLGNGKEISIGQLAEKILSLMGKDLPINCEDRRMRPTDSEVERLCADNKKARELLGWEPAYSLESGLQKTIEWIRENHEQYRSNAYVV